MLPYYGGGSFAYGDTEKGWLSGSEVGEGKFIIYNKTLEGYVDGGFSDWGTNGGIYKNPRFYTFTANGTGYNINTYVDNSGGKGTDCFMQGSTWLDGKPVAQTFEIVDADMPTYKFGNGGKYFGGTAKNAVWTLETADKAQNTEWLLISEADYKSKLKELTYDGSTFFNATALIKGARVYRNYMDGIDKAGNWTYTHSGDSWHMNLNGGSNQYRASEFFDCTCDIRQTLNDIPNGKYVLSVQGFLRSSTKSGKLFANESEQPIMLMSEGPALAAENMENAAKAFANGDFDNNKVTVMVTDHTLTIGLKKETNIGNDWFIFNNFSLYFYGLDLTELKDAINNRINNAKSMTKIESSVATGLADAIKAAEDAVKTNDEDALINAQNELNAAIAAAQPSYDAYNKLSNALTSTAARVASLNISKVTAAYDVSTIQTAYDNTTYTAQEAEDAVTAVSTAFQTAVKNAYADIEDGKYYIQNTQSGQYLTSGANWGTRAVLYGMGLEYTFKKESDGKYTLISNIQGEGKALRPSDGYNDQSGSWEILKADNDELYLFNGSRFFCSITSSADDSFSDTPCGWKLVTEAERKALVNGVDENVDATIFINDADCAFNLFGTKWQNKGACNSDGGLVSNNNVEFFSAKKFDMNQELTGLPTGYYKLTMRGFTRDGDAKPALAAYEAGNENLAVLYAGEKEVPLQSVFVDQKTAADGGWASNLSEKYYIPNSVGQAAECFAAGGYLNTIDEILVTDGTLKIGVKFDVENANGNNWTMIDDFRLTYVKPAASATMTIGSAKYGTFCAPFDVTLPEGVTAVTATAVTESTISYDVVATEGETLKANTPVVVKSENAVSATFYGKAATTDFVTKNLLTGVYKDYTCKDGDYILQNQGGKVGFYRVDTSKSKPGIKANRVYLTLPADANPVRVIYLEGEDIATGINAAEAAQSQDIYDLAGRKVNKVQKGGIYIVGNKKVLK